MLCLLTDNTNATYELHVLMLGGAGVSNEALGV